MKTIKHTFFLLIIPVILSMAHKYYVSVTQIAFIKEKKSVQIISRIDVDDFEFTLRERYDKNIDLTTIDENPIVDDYIQRYLKQKLEIKINTKEVDFNFIGKDYDNDQIVCYLEIENIASISTIEISNTLLFDLFQEQKNIIKLKINDQVNNLIFTYDDRNQYLNFK
jgi:hypothetical protein